MVWSFYGYYRIKGFTLALIGLLFKSYELGILCRFELTLGVIGGFGVTYWGRNLRGTSSFSIFGGLRLPMTQGEVQKTNLHALTINVELSLALWKIVSLTTEFKHGTRLGYTFLRVNYRQRYII